MSPDIRGSGPLRHSTDQWHLTDLELVKNDAVNAVLYARRSAQSVVLKLCRHYDDYQHEKQALHAFGGRGCVQLLKHDDGARALLLERAVPGITLRSMAFTHEQQSIDIVCHVMQQLHQAPVQSSIRFKTLDDWFVVLNSAYSFLGDHCSRAQILAQKLIKTTSSRALLHGDLHHENILSCGAAWKAIDPKGVVGDPLFEIGTFVRNPVRELLQQLNPRDSMAARIAHFAHNLHIADTQRIKDWCYVSAVLSVCWLLEDRLDPADGMAVVEIIDQL